MKLDFDTVEYIKKIRKDPDNYFHTFLNHQNLAAGIIVLPPGATEIFSFKKIHYTWYKIRDSFCKEISKLSPKRKNTIEYCVIFMSIIRSE